MICLILNLLSKRWLLEYRDLNTFGLNTPRLAVCSLELTELMSVLVLIEFNGYFLCREDFHSLGIVFVFLGLLLLILFSSQKRGKNFSLQFGIEHFLFFNTLIVITSTYRKKLDLSY